MSTAEIYDAQAQALEDAAGAALTYPNSPKRQQIWESLMSLSPRPVLHKPHDIRRWLLEQAAWYRTKAKIARAEEREKLVEQRALQLQAAGPDEFPYQYYRFLAEKEIDRG